MALSADTDGVNGTVITEIQIFFMSEKFIYLPVNKWRCIVKNKFPISQFRFKKIFQKKFHGAAFQKDFTSS